MTYEAWRISYQSSEQAARAAYAECARLQAKIAEMETQEPVAWLDDGTCRAGSDSTALRIVTGATKQEMPALVAASFSVPLYALPGAQNVPEKLCYDSRWEISIDYVDGWNAAVDMMRGKSPSWHCPDCCIAFPFGAPKSCPHDDARCSRLLSAAPESKPCP